MPQLKIGLNLPSLRLPLAKALAVAGELGVQAVELDVRHELRPSELSHTALRQLRKMLDDHRLRVSSVTYRTRRGYNVPHELDARVAGTKEAMRVAHALGASVVVNSVGHIPEKAEGHSWDLLLQVLTELGQHGQHVGALLAAQTGSVDGADLARLIAALPAGSLLVDFDPGQLIVNGFSAAEALSAIGADIAHVRATDGVRDLARGRGLDVPLGRGSVDWPALLGALEERNYRGYFTVQCEGNSQRNAATNPRDELTAAVSYLRRL